MRHFRVLASSLLLAVAMAISAPNGAAGSPTSPNAAIDALVAAPSLNCDYHADGAADATVLQNPVAPVLAIVKMRGSSIRLLIDHLDDGRLTAATFDPNGQAAAPIRVPVGYVCLDILTQIVRTKHGIIRSDCPDDGLGACVASKYYFWPDSFGQGKTSSSTLARIRTVKANWSRALARGWLSFEQPRWLQDGAQQARATERAQRRLTDTSTTVARAR